MGRKKQVQDNYWEEEYLKDTQKQEQLINNGKIEEEQDAGDDDDIVVGDEVEEVEEVEDEEEEIEHPGQKTGPTFFDSEDEDEDEEEEVEEMDYTYAELDAAVFQVLEWLREYKGEGDDTHRPITRSALESAIQKLCVVPRDIKPEFLVAFVDTLGVWDLYGSQIKNKTLLSETLAETN
jgi:hypothetical protein